jgi:hypothetical protein
MNAVPGCSSAEAQAGPDVVWLQCTATWNKLDTGKSGSVSQSQAQGVVTDFKAADTNNDGNLSKSEFMAACNKGLVTASAATGSSARGMAATTPAVWRRDMSPVTFLRRDRVVACDNEQRVPNYSNRLRESDRTARG